MPRYRLPEMSIAQSNVTPGVFQGVTFTPQTADMNILARSLAQAEERQNKAIEKKSAIDAALGELESKLNPAEAEWFADYKNNVKQDIQRSVDAGDFGTAIRTATSAAGKIASDSAITGRIKNQELIKSKQDEVNKRALAKDIDEDVALAWTIDHQDKYKSEDIVNNEGQVIGVKQWKEDWNPVRRVDSAKKIEDIFRSGITPDKKVTGSTTGGFDLSTNISTQGGGHHSIEEITKADFEKVLRNRLITDNEWLASLEQDRKVADIMIKNIEEQLNNLDETNPSNQSKIQELKAQKRKYEQDLGGDIRLKDPWDYFKARFKDSIEALPYTYKEDTTVNVKSPVSIKGLGGGSDEDTQYVVVKEPTKGNPVE